MGTGIPWERDDHGNQRESRRNGNINMPNMVMGVGIVSVIMEMGMATFPFLARIPMDLLIDFDPA